MKSIAATATICLFVFQAYAQNPVPSPDSLLSPEVTDSIDFKDPPLKKNDTAVVNPQGQNPVRRENDSLHIDDRKPPKRP